MAEHLDDLEYRHAPDVVIAFLRAELDDVPDADIDTHNPERIKGPAVRVLRVGGTDDGVDDIARMAVVAMNTSYDGAVRLASRIRKVMAGDHGIGGLNDAEVAMPDGSTTWVAGCSTDVAPNRVPATNPKIDQEPGYYRVVIPAQ